MKIHHITDYLEHIAPLSLQESYDNSGLLVGDKNRDIKKVLITLDVTEEIIKEAVEKECEMIISHHPLMFGGIKKITGSSAEERILSELIKKDIALYAIHTNIDNIKGGVNGILGKKLQLMNMQILSPIKNVLRKLVTFSPSENAAEVRKALFDAGAGQIGDYDCCSYNTHGEGTFRALENANPHVGEINKLHFEKEIRIEVIYPDYAERNIIHSLLEAHPYEEVAYDIYPLMNNFKEAGAGMIGDLIDPMKEETFLKRVKEITGIPVIRHSKFLGKEIKKVAICGGAGSFLINDAKKAGADILLTSDIKYHQFFEAEKKIVIADIGHYESEQFVKELIYTLLIEKFPNFALLISEHQTNSINYM